MCTAGLPGDLSKVSFEWLFPPSWLYLLRLLLSILTNWSSRKPDLSTSWWPFAGCWNSCNYHQCVYWRYWYHDCWMYVWGRMWNSHSRWPFANIPHSCISFRLDLEYNLGCTVMEKGWQTGWLCCLKQHQTYQCRRAAPTATSGALILGTFAWFVILHLFNSAFQIAFLSLFLQSLTAPVFLFFDKPIFLTCASEVQRSWSSCLWEGIVWTPSVLVFRLDIVRHRQPCHLIWIKYRIFCCESTMF